MPRSARFVIPDVAHHITQRGNDQQKVFFREDDYGFYLRTLGEQSKRYGLSIMAYCLMPNHVHLVAVPEKFDSLSKGLGRTHLRHARFINSLYGRSGHLWQNRFFSCVLDRQHLFCALRYVELNPVRAGLVRSAEEYRWSSARAHTKQSDPTGLLDLRLWPEDWDGYYWRQQLALGDDPLEIHELRRITRLGQLPAVEISESAATAKSRRSTVTVPDSAGRQYLLGLSR